LASAGKLEAEMSRDANSRDSPDELPAIMARREPDQCTRPPSPASCFRASNAAAICASSETSMSRPDPTELGGDLGDPLLKALADVGEGKLGAFAPARLGDPVRDRSIGKYASDQQPFAGQEAHGVGR
jgi:hypothetical protein